MRKFTKEHKENMGKAQKGKKISNSHKLNISEGHKGLKLSDETKNKIKNSLIGSKFTNERKEKISKAHTGKKLSEAHKKRIKESITNHHIYLKENGNEILKMERTQHRQLHARAYDYLVEINKVDDYIRWFDKKYKLKEV